MGAGAEGIIQAGVGLAQTVIGGIRAHKAQKQLENMRDPIYTGSHAIDDYYGKALAKYNVSPYDTLQYKASQQALNKGYTQTVSGLQDRRLGLMGISTAQQNYDDANLRAAAGAEAQQNANFAQLGEATKLKSAEDKFAFNVNQEMPFERKYNMYAAKAAGGNQIMNAGLSNIFGGLDTSAAFSIAKKYGVPYFKRGNPSPYGAYSGFTL